MRSRLLAALFVIASVLVWHGVTSACSRPPTLGLERGLLGRAPLGGSPPTTAPRNMVVIDSTILDAEDAPVPLEPVPGTTWTRPAEPLAAGVVVHVEGFEVTTTEAIDEAPPSAPSLISARLDYLGDAGCGRDASGCTGTDLIVRIEPATDDQTAAEHLTYALFGGATADEAAAATSPLRLLFASSVEPTEILEIWDSLEPEMVAWVALAAVDQAGNLSARTAPVAVAD